MSRRAYEDGHVIKSRPSPAQGRADDLTGLLHLHSGLRGMCITLSVTKKRIYRLLQTADDVEVNDECLTSGLRPNCFCKACGIEIAFTN